MLNSQFMTDRERNEAAGIARRRAIEEERKKRIFNPRHRLIGNDYDALLKQIEENKQRQAQDKIQEKLFAQECEKLAKAAMALEQKEKEARMKMHRDINNYRLYCQRPEDRREFDLNDPNFIKNQIPPRTNEEVDKKLGPSAAQIFEGEDSLNGEREKAQKEQIKAWLDQQMLEKEMEYQRKRIAEETFKKALIADDQRAIELDNLERELRKRMGQACIKFNKALADEKYREMLKQEEEIKKDNFCEMKNILTSDMLAENSDSQSNFGANRKVGSVFKGMSQEEKENIRKMQMAQIEEARQKKQMEAQMDKEFDDYTKEIQKTVFLRNKELERKQRDLQKQLAEENLRLAEEQKKRKDFLDKFVYTNRPSTAFYDQFNKSTR